MTTENISNGARQAEDRRRELRAQLARKVAFFVGSAESQTTDVPGLTLYCHAAPTAPAPVTYEPSVALVVQGRKQVELGPNAFFYDASRYLLTSLDLPVVSRVVEASPETPYLCLRLKLEMPTVREILSREDSGLPLTSSDALAMSTAETTVELLDAFHRLLDLLNAPQDMSFLSPMIQREIIYRILRGTGGQRLRAIATTGDQSYRTARVISWIRDNYTKPLRVEDLAHIAGMSMSTLHHHFRVLTSMSPLQYQKQLRLQAARQRMLVEGIDAASAAFSVGYESASQFNREYIRKQADSTGCQLFLTRLSCFRGTAALWKTEPVVLEIASNGAGFTDFWIRQLTLANRKASMIFLRALGWPKTGARAGLFPSSPHLPANGSDHRDPISAMLVTALGRSVRIFFLFV